MIGAGVGGAGGRTVGIGEAVGTLVLLVSVLQTVMVSVTTLTMVVVRVTSDVEHSWAEVEGRRPAKRRRQRASETVAKTVAKGRRVSFERGILSDLFGVGSQRAWSNVEVAVVFNWLADPT